MPLIEVACWCACIVMLGCLRHCSELPPPSYVFINRGARNIWESANWAKVLCSAFDDMVPMVYIQHLDKRCGLWRMVTEAVCFCICAKKNCSYRCYLLHSEETGRKELLHSLSVKGQPRHKTSWTEAEYSFTHLLFRVTRCAYPSCHWASDRNTSWRGHQWITEHS